MIFRVESTVTEACSCEAAVVFDAFYRAALRRLGVATRVVGDYELRDGERFRGATEIAGELPPEIERLNVVGLHKFIRDRDGRRVASFCRVSIDDTPAPETISCDLVFSRYYRLRYQVGPTADYISAEAAMMALRGGYLP
jgi:hypothetical protein